jgi:VanZ family protein
MIIAWACLFLIVVLSVVPGSDRPHTVLPGGAEHFVAYAGTGFFFALGYHSGRERRLAWIGLTLLSCLSEVIQLMIPGRSPNVLDALASSSGAAFGLTVGIVAAAMIKLV